MARSRFGVGIPSLSLAVLTFVVLIGWRFYGFHRDHGGISGKFAIAAFSLLLGGLCVLLAIMTGGSVRDPERDRRMREKRRREVARFERFRRDRDRER